MECGWVLKIYPRSGLGFKYGITEDDDTEAVRNGGFGSTTGKH